MAKFLRRLHAVPVGAAVGSVGKTGLILIGAFDATLLTPGRAAVSSSCSVSETGSSESRIRSLPPDTAHPHIPVPSRMFGGGGQTATPGSPQPSDPLDRIRTVEDDASVFRVIRTESDRKDEDDRKRREAWAMCRQLKGYDSIRESFEIEWADLGSCGSFPDSLHVDLRATNLVLVNAVWWWNPLRNGDPIYDWTDLENLHRRASRVIGRHTWLWEWRNTTPGRRVELHAFGTTIGDTASELDHYVLPIWREAGLRGAPSFVVLARRDSFSWAQIYFGDEDSRALVTKVSEPDTTTGHWLDGLEVSFHPKCKSGEKYERYAVVDSSGHWEVRHFGECEQLAR